VRDEANPDFGNRVRFSRLKLIGKSPAHYHAGVDTETSAKDKGTAVHAVLLGGRDVVCYDEKTDSGKQRPRHGKDWDRFRELHHRDIIVTPKEYEQVMGMVEAVRAHRQAMELIGHADGREETLLFDFLRLEARTTPDLWARPYVAELKTSISSAPSKFMWQSLRFGYHAQMAFHRIGLKRAKMVEPPESFVIAVESTPPYPVTVFRFTPRALEQGEKTIRAWCETLKGCLASDQWPPYAQSTVDLDVPDDEAAVSFDEAVEEQDVPF
jgi:hypothetical protein